MGKMYYALTLIILFQIAIFLFYGEELPAMSLLDAITGVQDWSANTFITYLSGALGVAGIAVVSIGLTYKATDLVFLGIGFAFFQFGKSYVTVFNHMKDSGVLGANTNPILLSLIFIPIILSWIIIVIEFSRGRD